MTRHFNLFILILMTYVASAQVVDIEKFAKTTMKMKKVGSGIMDYLSNPAITAGIGGLAAGGGTYLAESQNDGENEKEFHKRRIMDALTNGLAGAAVGGAVPVAADAIGNIAHPQEDGLFKRTLKGLGGYGAYAAGGATGGTILDKWLHGTKAITETEGLKSKFQKTINDAVNVVDDYGNVKNLASRADKDGLQQAIDGLTRHNEVRESLINVIKKVPKGDFMPLVKKIRNPAIAAGAAVTLPFILKKLDQLSSQ